MTREEIVNKLNTSELSVLDMLVIYIYVKTGKKISLNINHFTIFEYQEFFLDIHERVFKHFNIMVLLDTNNKIIKYY